MPTRSDIWNDVAFRDWLRSNARHMQTLCDLIGALKDAAEDRAMKPGDTDFEKGHVAAYKELIEDLKRLASDTGTETGPTGLTQ